MSLCVASSQVSNFSACIYLERFRGSVFTRIIKGTVTYRYRCRPTQTCENSQPITLHVSALSVYRSRFGALPSIGSAIDRFSHFCCAHGITFK